MSQSPDAPDHARREFLKLAGAAAIAAALPSATQAFAQGTPAKKPAATTTPAPTPTPAPTATAPAAPAPPSQDALALAGVLRRRVKAQLTDAQWESIARDFDGDLAIGKRLRALGLANGDEPDITFKA
ncbi:MAG: hypothetical protein IPJ04_12090 [Candidatus Eisenbacteria bacterium]|nr:hypothetical protein [Candidatus Eisenbacteria bacterium]